VKNLASFTQTGSRLLRNNHGLLAMQIPAAFFMYLLVRAIFGFFSSLAATNSVKKDF
jgi:hypothetical protein